MAKYVGGEVATVGVTWTVALASPAASTRRVLDRVKWVNRDTVQHTVKLRHKKGATTIEFNPVTLAAGKGADIPCDGVLLDATDETIEIQSDATATTIEPIAFIQAFEEP